MHLDAKSKHIFFISNFYAFRLFIDYRESNVQFKRRVPLFYPCIVLILTEYKISEYLPPIIETLNIFSDSEPEANSSNFVPNKDKISSIEDLSISSDSESDTEIEEPSFAHNKNFLPKITHICSLGENKVKLIKYF